MSEHINGWLVAYHDGELGERRSKKVAAHLENCEVCREELEKLSSLRLLLQENPEASDLMSLDRFVAQVGLRLQHRPTRTTFQRTLAALWILIPAGMLGIWAFAQALSSAVSLMEVALDLGLWGDLAGVFAATSQNTLLGSFSWKLGVSIVIGLISLSWLASWWISQQANQARKATE
jgi:predicted anti-sigma-YlaC factor YlaD